MFNSFPVPKPDSGGSNIRSRQSGTVTYTTQNNTVTILPVDLTKAIVRISYTLSAVASSADYFLMARFTSNSQISIDCDSGTSATKVVTWEVIEFNNVKSLQSGQATNSSTAGVVSTTAVVSPVNTGKCLLFYSMRTTSATTGLVAGVTRGEVTNSTTLTFSLFQNAVGVATIQYYLVEFI